MFDDTIGATMVGVILTTFTYGIATIQVYRYWDTYRGDSRFTRLYILLLWLLDTSKVASICQIQYYYTITNYGNVQALLSTTWSLSYALCMTAVITFMVQSFLARRTWNFARRVRSTRIPQQAIQALGAVIAMVALTQLAFGLVSTALAWRVRYFINVINYRWLGISWLGSAAVCDILLVCSLSTVLVTQRNGFKQTDMLINRIILFTVNTGLLTSLVAITDLILFCSMPNFLHFIPNFLLGTLYIITLLATLHTGETGPSPPHSAHSGIFSRSNTKWNDPGDIPLPRRAAANTQTPATLGVQVNMPEIVRVQVDQETCIKGSQSCDGASQRSGDQEDIKCYDANYIPHTLV